MIGTSQLSGFCAPLSLKYFKLGSSKRSEAILNLLFLFIANLNHADAAVKFGKIQISQACCHAH